MINIDAWILRFDQGLRTLCTPARSQRAHPDQDIPEHLLSETEKKHAVGLMRVNHCGEICAQALYQGQALTAKDPEVVQALKQAAEEEVEHLAWTAQRVKELGGGLSVLNPVWYIGSLSVGIAAGLLGDKWNLGFLAETERQVVAHLEGHMASLPDQDAKSRAIVAQMKIDEAQHAQTAVAYGAADLAPMIQWGMKNTAKIMTTLSYRI